jgi:hypothetical protein
VNGGGADDSMVDLSEDVTEMCQEESATGGPGSAGFAETFVPVPAKQGTEVDTVKMQASRSATLQIRMLRQTGTSVQCPSSYQ